MKRKFFLCWSAICMFSSAGVLFAQATLTALNTSPAVGEIVYNFHCDTAHAEGAAGAAVTWDFSSLAVTTNDTVGYYACSPTYDCTRFPGTNIAAAAPSNISQVFYQSDASILSMVGIYVPSLLSADTLQDPMDVYHFPFTYTNTFTDSFMMHFDTEYQFGRNTFVCDGYGTLILPIGTYTNALRIRGTEVSTDSITGTPATVVHVVRDFYRWVVPGMKITMTIDYSNSLVSPVTKSITYSKTANPPGLGVQNTVRAVSVKFYPNPMGNEAILKIDNYAQLTNAFVVISDLTGRKLKQQQVMSQETIINREGLSAGVYFYYVINNGEKSNPGKIVVE